LLFSPVNRRLPVFQSKNLFSDSFHKVDVVQNEILREKTENSGTFKGLVRFKVNRRDQNAIDKKDLVKFLHLSEGEEDLNFCLTVLQRTISEDQERSFELIWLYMQMCYIQNLPLQATMAWNDPVIRATHYQTDRSRTSRLYLDLLFTNGKYSQVLDTFNNNFDRLVRKIDCITITCLACYKLGTKSDLDAGLHILDHPNYRVDSPHNVGYQAIALLAYNLKELNVAYDLLVKYGSVDMGSKSQKFKAHNVVRKHPVLPTSLMLLVLADLGWLEEAVMLLWSRYGDIRYLNTFAVQKVLVAVINSGNDDLAEKMDKIMNIMPKNTTAMLNLDLEELLLREIKPRLK